MNKMQLPKILIAHFRLLIPFIAFLSFFYGNYSILRAQYYGNIWYFGEHAGIDFYTGEAVALNNGAMNAPAGCATISNSQGELAFYTNGQTVWNKNHSEMPNGTGLEGDLNAAQTGLVVPYPSNHLKYFIFTVPARGNSPGLSYSIVDMNAGAGLGDVIQKNVFLRGPVTEKITAVAHANNRDYWVMVHDWESATFASYLVTPEGINTTPILSTVGSVHQGLPRNASGCMKASPNGAYIAVAVEKYDLVELFTFNNTTGQIAHVVTFPPIENAYGVEFSPNSQLLYITSDLYEALSRDYIIYQANVSSGIAGTIYLSLTQVATYSDGYFLPEYRQGQLQIGPDEKIYCARNTNQYLGVIHSPNTLGTGCNYQKNGFHLHGALSGLGLPSFVQTFYKPPLVNYAFKNNICFGSAGQFNGRSSETDVLWDWDFGDPETGDSNYSHIQNPEHYFSKPGKYKVRLTVTFGDTSATTEKFVQVLPFPVRNIPDTLYSCKGEREMLDAGNPGASYYWSNGYTTRSIVVYKSGTYSAKVSYGNCYDIFETKMIFLPLPSPALGNDTMICGSGSVFLDAKNIGANFLWNTGDTSQTIEVSKAGLFIVQIEKQGCIRYDSIWVRLYPPFELHAPETLGICVEQKEKIELFAGGAEFYEWQHSGETTWKTEVDTPGIYILKGIGKSGCVDWDTIVVVDSCIFAILPTAFSPNSDGINDEYLPISKNIEEFEMSIFARGGNEVFHSYEATFGWDGRKNEVVAPEGVYFVIVKVNATQRGKKHHAIYYQNITLIR